ncbi:hypothetical protein [Streptomyces sp. NPDC127036]
MAFSTVSAYCSGGIHAEPFSGADAVAAGRRVMRISAGLPVKPSSR